MINLNYGSKAITTDLIIKFHFKHQHGSTKVKVKVPMLK